MLKKNKYKAISKRRSHSSKSIVTSSSKVNYFISMSLVIVGTLLILVSGLHTIVEQRTLRVNAEAVHAFSQHTTIVEIPTHITIKWFIDTDIEPMLYQEGKWGVSDAKATYLLQSARPTEKGNMIIYGHNKRSILGNIRALRGNEDIVVQTNTANTYHYKIVLLKEVDPNDSSLLQPTTKEVLTMYTCSGFFDTRRFIVRAVRVI